MDYDKITATNTQRMINRNNEMKEINPIPQELRSAQERECNAIPEVRDK